jgi:hypothetical protein
MLVHQAIKRTHGISTKESMMHQAMAILVTWTLKRLQYHTISPL